MKDKILNVIMGISILALIGAGYREYLIHNGKLTSDLNANGYSITNLPAGFFPAETDPTVPSWAKESAPPSETDPTVPEWAKEPNKPSYTATEVGAYPNASGVALESNIVSIGDDATNYTDAVAGQVRAEIPTNNAQLVNGAEYVTKAVTNGLLKTETDPTVPAWAKAASAPLPPNYATVSNRAMTALQSYTETDPAFSAWADAHVVAGGSMVDWAIDALYALKLGDGFSTTYSADDITAISNGFAAADESLSSRLSLASLAATNYTDEAIGAAIASTNPTFSNAVLSVGLGIDTNAVAVINALVEAGDELPIGGAATVGGLLLALAAAVAALKRTKADASALRYAMPESVALVAENDAATLVCADRAVTNATIASGFSTLNLTFPAEVSGYVRDFYLRITVAAGQSAPAISVPQGITIENAGGAVPEIADGEASAAATTLVWFSETAPGIFTAKSETVKAVV